MSLMCVLLFPLAIVVYQLSLKLLLHFDGRIESDFLITIAYSLQALYTIGFVLQFSFAAICIRDRFRVIHTKVYSMTSLNSFEVDIVLEIYEKLFKAIKKVNKHLTAHLIVIFGYTLISATFSIYTMVHAYLQNSELIYVYFFGEGLWLLFETILMIAPVRASTLNTIMTQKTEEVAYKTIQKTRFQNKESRSKFKEFSNYIARMKCQLHTAIFNIDWNLLFKVSKFLMTSLN